MPLCCLKNGMPFCVITSPAILKKTFTMVKTQSNEKCVGHRGSVEEKRRGEKSTTTKARGEYLLTNDM